MELNLYIYSGLGNVIALVDLLREDLTLSSEEVIKIAATIRTNLEYGERTKLGDIPNILFSPLKHKEGAAK